MFRQQGENTRADEIESGLAKDRERLQRIESMTDKALLEQPRKLRSRIGDLEGQIREFKRQGENDRAKELEDELVKVKADYKKFQGGK